MWIENYFPLIAADIESAKTALQSPLPEQVKSGIENELSRLLEIQQVLSGATQKSKVHSLRAALRWKRQELNAERDAAKRKRLELELKQIEEDIKKEGEKKRAK